MSNQSELLAQYGSTPLIDDDFERGARTVIRGILKHHGIINGVVEADLLALVKTAASAPAGDGGEVLTSAELLKGTASDMSKPFVRGPFPPEMRMIPARDGIEAQRGLNDVFPGDPYPAPAMGSSEWYSGPGRRVTAADAWEIVQSWLDQYEQEEKEFSRYRDDVVLDGVMTARMRRTLSAALSANSGEPVAFITKAGLENWLKGDCPENHVLLRTGGDLRVALYARPPAPAVEVREAKRLINERLEDLQTANALYGKDQRLSAPDKVARNDREISWLKDLRSYLSASPREIIQKGEKT